MAFPDREKLQEILEGAAPAGADPSAVGAPAPPAAGPPPGTPGPVPPVPPTGGEGETAVPPQSADVAASMGLIPGGEEIPPEPGAEEGALMPGNLTPEEQEQIQQALAMAARRKMMGGV